MSARSDSQVGAVGTCVREEKKEAKNKFAIPGGREMASW